MKSLVFLSQKGGSGKTTLSVHTAVTAQESGEQVVIIDTDPQQSATTWADARESDSPPVATISVGEIDKVMNAARQEGISLAVVDTAPHATPDASKVAQIADLVVIPVRPSAFDIAAAGNAVQIARPGQKRCLCCRLARSATGGQRDTRTTGRLRATHCPDGNHRTPSVCPCRRIG